MGTIRKYWFMLFLGVALVTAILAELEPSWEKEIRTQVAIAFAGLVLWYVLNKLDRAESK